MLREWLKWQCYVFILYVGMEICERDGDGDEERARVRARTPRWRARARNQWRRHSAHQLFSRKRAQVTTTRDVRDFFSAFCRRRIKSFLSKQAKKRFRCRFRNCHSEKINHLNFRLNSWKQQNSGDGAELKK